MSDYGIIIRNKKKNIVIDSVYNNFSYYGSDTSALNEYTNIIDITPTTSNLLCLIKPNTDSFVSPVGLLDTTTEGTYESVIIASNDDCYCDWILYSDNTTSNGDYGMVVRNQDNVIVFNSNDIGYINVIQKYDELFLGFNGTPNLYTDITVIDADNYFYINHSRYAMIVGSGIYTHYTIGLKKIDATTLRISWVPIATGSSTSVGTTSTYMNMYFNVFEIKPPPSL